MRCKLCTLNFRGTTHSCVCDTAGGRQTRLAVEVEYISSAPEAEPENHGADVWPTAGRDHPQPLRALMLGDNTPRPPTVPLHRIGGKILLPLKQRARLPFPPSPGDPLPVWFVGSDDAAQVRDAWTALVMVHK